MIKRRRKVNKLFAEGITAETKFTEIEPFLNYLTKETTDAAMKSAVKRYGEPLGLSIGELFRCLHGDFGIIGVDLSNPLSFTALQYFWTVAFKDMMTTLGYTLAELTPPQTPEAKQAAQACKQLSFEEGTQIFLREYFGLDSFDKALELHIPDLIIAKKDKYNQAAFERALSAIHEQKNRKR